MNFYQAILKDIINNILGPKYRKRVGKPYMRGRELIIFEELVRNLQPTNVLEWGAGYSTTYFPKFLRKEFKWLSIENNQNWISHLRELNKHPSVRIELVPEKQGGSYGTDNDGTYEAFKDYIEFPSAGAPYDYIVIDGRARSACLKKAFELVSDKGIVVMHDANRTYYHEHFGLFDYCFLITDNRKRAGGLAILSKKMPIDQLVNTRYHQQKWRLVRNRLARFLMI